MSGHYRLLTKRYLYPNYFVSDLLRLDFDLDEQLQALLYIHQFLCSSVDYHYYHTAHQMLPLHFHFLQLFF